MVCNSCSQEIARGDEYYTWEKRYGGPQYRHVSCGYPRQSDLSSAKTAQLHDAISDAQDQIASWDPDAESPDTSDLESFLSDVASTARDVAQEYRDSYDNLPENFQMGATGEALETVADELESWADEVESPSFSEDEPTYDEDPTESEEQIAKARQETLESWTENVRQEALDHLESQDVPEHQG